YGWIARARYIASASGTRGMPRRAWLSRQETVAEYVEEGGYPIAPVDFLPFGICPAVVGNGYFIDPAIEPGHLHSNLLLEAKTVRTDLHLLQDLSPKHLVAHLHIRQIEIGHHVTQGREELIADKVPEIQYTMRATVEAIAKDHIGPLLEDRLQEAWIVLGIIFQVGILDKHNVACHVRQRGPNGSAFALIRLMTDNLDREAIPGVALGKRLEVFPCPVRCTIIND